MYASALPDPVRHAEFYEGVPTRRLVAWVIDTAATVVLTALIVPFTAFTALFFLPALYLVVNLGWRVATVARFSATPGMWLCGIELRGADGGRLDTTTAALHALGYAVSVAFVMPQVVSVMLMAIGPRGQGLTDLVLGTAAIRRPGRG